MALYLQISNVSFSEILLVPLSLGNNAIPLTFRNMPFLGPFDAHVIIFCLLLPYIFEKNDKKLKFVLLTGLSLQFIIRIILTLAICCLQVCF